MMTLFFSTLLRPMFLATVCLSFFLQSNCNEENSAPIIAPINFNSDANVNAINSNSKKTGKVITVNPNESIQEAINLASPGDTIKVNQGNYTEPLSIISSEKISKDNITIIGKEETDSDDKRPKIIITKLSEIVLIKAKGIVFQGFDISNGNFLEKGENNQGVTGIHIEGGSKDITITDNLIQTIGMNYKKCGCYGNSHAINVKSYSDQKIENVKIIKNTISNIHLGRSEAITINGNVSDFTLEKNKISDVDNIGIDIGGFQENDQSGNPLNYQAGGKVLQNELSTSAELFQQNPGQKSYWIAGIYVDGGKDVTVDKNSVTNFGFGIVIGSEKCGKSVDNVVVSNNLIAKNVINGISVGHGLEFKKKKHTVENDQRSSANSVSVINNTIIVDNLKEDGGALRLVSHRLNGIQNLTIANNLIFAAHKEDFIKKENFVWQKESKELNCQKKGQKITADFRKDNPNKFDVTLVNNLFYNQLTKQEFDTSLSQLPITTSKSNYFINPLLQADYS